MKRKILFLIMWFSIMLGLYINVLSANAAESISVGDYIQMGEYNGQGIVWRCVDIDENGPLMLSDKIICLKAFDVKGDNTYRSSHARCFRNGECSNYWADSNIRCWLNSTATSGDVEWLCGNPPKYGYNAYDQEAGFLTNFSLYELNAIKEVTQKSLLCSHEQSSMLGTSFHKYNTSITDVIQNYDTAYFEMVTDKMFLIDVKQVNAVYNNGNILGANYYIGMPTEQCVENSEYTNAMLSANKKWTYWLRTPYTSENDNGHNTRCVDADGKVSGGGNQNYLYQYGYRVGIRPAFYLDLPYLIYKSGNGTAEYPYTVSNINADGFTREPEYSDGTLNVHILLPKEHSECKCYFAVFDCVNNMIALDIEKIGVDTRTIEVDIDVDITDTDLYTVKCFVFDNDLQPIGNAYKHEFGSKPV